MYEKTETNVDQKEQINFQSIGYTVKYAVLDSAKIFNLCGPLSAGPRGWTNKAIQAREVAAQKYIQVMNEKRNFYTRLEESMRLYGVRNPILVNAGWCPSKKLDRLPPEMQENHESILMCHTNGGSRLWIAAKQGLKLECIISDFVDMFPDARVINTANEILSFYKDRPQRMNIDRMSNVRGGVSIVNLPQVQLTDEDLK